MNVLLAVQRGRTTLAAEVDQARRGLGDERDRALLLELTNGTLRWRARLDALLAQCSSRPLEDLDPVIRGTLRLAAYQLDHLDRVPAHAALNEAVELTRVFDLPGAAGFVNAVLRTFVRTRSQLVLPERPNSSVDKTACLAYLTVSLSHPEWLAARWLDRVGFDQAVRWCEFNNRPPEITIRARDAAQRDELLRELLAAGADAAPARFVNDAIRLSPGSLGALPNDLRARVVVQEEASQIVAHAVGAQPDERVLDLCAAPGGKTLVLASAMRGRGLLVASDFRSSRVRLLHAALSAAGIGAQVVRLNAAQPLPFAAVFDRLLLDAPCSGLGTLRLNPDLKWSRQPSDLDAFATAQTTMLAHAAAAVRPGGVIVYATCSSEPEENEQVVDAFLAVAPAFRLVAAAPGPAVTSPETLIDSRGFLRTLPPRDELDAFFAAVLVQDPAA